MGIISTSFPVAGDIDADLIGNRLTGKLHPRNIIHLFLENDMTGSETTRFLRSRGIDCLYHFTSRRNVPSIQSLGCLMSWFDLDQQGIVYTPSSDSKSRDLDRKLGLERFVRLAFEPRPKMYWSVTLQKRVEDLEVLSIPIDWLESCQHVLFSKGNACSHAAVVGEHPHILPDELLSMASTSSIDKMGSYDLQAELLVLGTLPIIFNQRIAS